MIGWPLRAMTGVVVPDLLLKETLAPTLGLAGSERVKEAVNTYKLPETAVVLDEMILTLKPLPVEKVETIHLSDVPNVAPGMQINTSPAFVVRFTPPGKTSELELVNVTAPAKTRNLGPR
jgi:hypothetical protein